MLATVSNYVRPPAFDEAAARLRDHHLVVLAGAPGSGRRAGAMALLRQVTGGPIVAISPAVTAQDLAEREYRGHYGYLVVDSDRVGYGAESHPDWADVAERVRCAGTYLVITTTAIHDQTAPAPVPYLAWPRPSIVDVLRGHLASNWAKDDVDKLVDLLVPRLPADYTLRWLACLVRLVNARRDPAQALQDMEEMSGRQVNRWFGQRPTRRELAKVAAAAFLAGSSELTYRSQLARLEQILMDHEPVWHHRRSHPQDGSASNRQPAAGSDGLLRSRHVPSPAGNTPVISFKKHSYQRFVLAQIWDTSESWFLAAVGEWVDGTVSETERLAVASGLALLAGSNFDVVETSFLDPWSLGRLGWPGKVTATYVLWFMCREETTARLALRTAIRWTDHGDANRRATAMIAFSGELGVSYPTDAAQKLWQLMTQTADLRTASRAALGRLFAVLVDQTKEASTVLTMLDAQRARFCRAGTRLRMSGIIVDAVLAILTVRSHRTGRPAVAELLHAEPDRREVVARLWACLIRSRSAGRDGLTALWNTLHAFHYLSGEPVRAASSLGSAMSTVLSTEERSRLRTGLARLDKRLCRAAGPLPAGALAACVEALGGE